MDTVQNISGVIVGGAPSAQSSRGAGLPELGVSPSASPARGPEMIELTRAQQTSTRPEFLSRPSWLFTANENILFCTALEALRYPDQNHVPRKFIEDWFAEKMVTLDSKWPAGQRFLRETIASLQQQTPKLKSKQQQGVLARQKEFLNSRLQALKRIERAYEAASADQKGQVFEELRRAQEQALVPLEQIEVQPPTIEEIALLELQTKIVRRIQGQTDRIYMAEQLAGRPYEEPCAAYFAGLQDEVLKEIDVKHAEIVASREKVDPKSKQSRMRRRSQVSNGSTMSGSATRVRFTNRELAMLIHWAYTYPKTEWSQKINQFYVDDDIVRSPEHVRDKLRDLVTKSKDVAHGGLGTLHVRSAGTPKASDPAEIQAMAANDIRDFKFPEGPLDLVPGGRYFDESACDWVDGQLPDYYLHKYMEEIQRLRTVVRSKCMRKPVKQPYPILDMGLHPGSLISSPENYAAEAEFALAAKSLQSAGLQGFDLEAMTKPGRKDYEIMASAALRQDFMQFPDAMQLKLDPAGAGSQVAHSQPTANTVSSDDAQVAHQLDLADADQVEPSLAHVVPSSVENQPSDSKLHDPALSEDPISQSQHPALSGVALGKVEEAVELMHRASKQKTKNHMAKAEKRSSSRKSGSKRVKTK